MMPLTTILQSTDNFLEASKLGEGGFGPIYKVLMIWIFFYIGSLLLFLLSFYVLLFI